MKVVTPTTIHAIVRFPGPRWSSIGGSSFQSSGSSSFSNQPRSYYTPHTLTRSLHTHKITRSITLSLRHTYRAHRKPRQAHGQIIFLPDGPKADLRAAPLELAHRTTQIDPQVLIRNSSAVGGAPRIALPHSDTPRDAIDKGRCARRDNNAAEALGAPVAQPQCRDRGVQVCADRGVRCCVCAGFGRDNAGGEVVAAVGREVDTDAARGRV